ncbi:MAG TPA: hypothetical protein VH559_04520, partial [Gemmatimonadaceae bacterium]
RVGPIAVRPAGATRTHAPYIPGKSYFGAQGYIEYIAGNAPVIFTAPHGGDLLPASIPDRTAARCGGSATTTTDLNTMDLVRAMQARYFARFGQYPHVVIAHIARRKLDLNRTGIEATCNNDEAEEALDEWHSFIDAAKESVLKSFGKGWYMDMHGQSHPIQRLELGYLLGTSDVQLSDAQLNADPQLRDIVSIATIAKTSRLPLSALIRGPTSLGTLYGNNGFRSVPSEQDPRPNGAPYFAAGDNTRRHSCGSEATSYGGTSFGQICGVQIEANYTGVRDNAANRDRFGDVTAEVLEQFLLMHWGLRLQR